MAEIRKHNPEAGNAIAQALRAAMGEPVRPNEPGAKPAATAVPANVTTSTTVVNFAVTAVTVDADDEDGDE
ncbi:MAG: hypothetical protein CVT62_00415 [Actinobacteria bacterium HGW-Actinobacteria-2]|nr:MAG: hypothetical protein CVT62_00415 [Actinobacteria bacterium HGW-Actinobacteria-2]